MKNNHFRSLTLLLTVAALGCASSAPRTAQTTTPVAPIEPPASVAALYAELEMAAREYESALQLVGAGGDLAEGQQRMDVARERIRTGATRCGAEPACEVERFVEVLDELFAGQGRFLVAQLAAPVDATAAEGHWSEGEEAVDEVLADTGEVAEVVPEVARTSALLRGSDLRERIEMNPMIHSELRDWLTWRRPMLMEAWHNYHYLRAEIAPIYEEAGLPEALLFAMIATESGGKVHVSSRAGATGLLQFMRYTGARFGLGVVDGFDQRYEPTAATRAAVAYLNEQFGVLNDDLEKALAAYNGGEGRMRGLHNRSGGASFWDQRIYSQLPRETRDYVPRILAAAWLFLHPEDYHLSWPNWEDAPITTVELTRASSLSDVAICLGSAQGAEDGWFRVLRNLNPRLEANQRVDAGRSLRLPQPLVETFQTRCVDDLEMIARVEEIHQGATKARALLPARSGSEKEWRSYRVAAGDTLSRIASRNSCTSVRELGRANNLRAPRYQIRVGQRLRVPVC